MLCFIGLSSYLLLSAVVYGFVNDAECISVPLGDEYQDECLIEVRENGAVRFMVFPVRLTQITAILHLQYIEEFIPTSHDEDNLLSYMEDVVGAAHLKLHSCEVKRNLWIFPTGKELTGKIFVFSCFVHPNFRSEHKRGKQNCRQKNWSWL